MSRNAAVRHNAKAAGQPLDVAVNIASVLVWLSASLIRRRVLV